MESTTAQARKPSAAKIVLPPAQVKELKDFIAQLPDKEYQLINVLHKAQAIFGYLPKPVQLLVAEEMGVPLARVYGVVTFYTFFTMEPRGKHPIAVCMGTACFVKGSTRVLNALTDYLHVDVGEVTPDGRFSINTLRCVGGCALAPVMMIGDRVFGNVTPAQIPEILAHFNEPEPAAAAH